MSRCIDTDRVIVGYQVTSDYEHWLLYSSNNVANDTKNGHMEIYKSLHMWLSRWKPSLMAHLVLWEKPIWSIQAAVALLYWTLATPD